MCKQFQEIVIPEKCLATDEQMTPFKVGSGLRHYLPKKNKNLGYKPWALAGLSGYVQNSEAQSEKQKKGLSIGYEAPLACDESKFVVIQLTNDLERNTHNFFFFFFF